LEIIKREDKYLHILAVYNRLLGLPSILFASIMAAALLAISTYTSFPIQGSPIGSIVTVLLIILLTNSVLMLINQIAMNYLFKQTLLEYKKRGLPYDSLQGVEALNDSSYRETRFSVLLTLLSTASLTTYQLWSNSPEITFIYLTMGTALVTFGFSILRREHVLDPDEMLRLYQPDTFPQVLSTDTILETFIDPFNRLKFRDYLETLTNLIDEKLKIGDATSKITVLLLQNLYGAISDEEVRNEASELLKNKGEVSAIEKHPVFGFQRLKIIVNNSRRLAPELMHIIDRLYVQLLDQLLDFKSEEIYIDADVTPEKTKGDIGRCLLFLYNNTQKAKTLSVSYISSSTCPATTEVTLTLPVRDFELPTQNTLPAYYAQDATKDGDEIPDIVGLMSRVMDDARVVWFNFEMKENGTKPMVVMVKDKDTGQTLYGRTYLIEASNNLSDLGIKILGLTSVFIGVILPILRLFNVPI
jgi:hypothetical protein